MYHRKYISLYLVNLHVKIFVCGVGEKYAVNKKIVFYLNKFLALLKYINF
jgi:hypothetical protein